MDDGAVVVEQATTMTWYEVAWQILGLFTAFTFVLFLIVITTLLVSDWHRASRPARRRLDREWRHKPDPMWSYESKTTKERRPSA